MSPRGRRPQGSDTRGDILAAARQLFATLGYTGTSLRAVARDAGVDPALVHHYFDSKATLFVAAIGPLMADAEPLRPLDIAKYIVDGPLDGVGERWVRAFLNIWDAPGAAQRFKALVHGATSGEAVLFSVREFLFREIFGPVVAQLGVDHAGVRAQLAATQLLGLGMVRYVAALPEITSLSSDQLVALIGPTVQRYLVGELPHIIIADSTIADT